MASVKLEAVPFLFI